VAHIEFDAKYHVTASQKLESIKLNADPARVGNTGTGFGSGLKIRLDTNQRKIETPPLRGLLPRLA
jgi:hypothetical protein